MESSDLPLKAAASARPAPEHRAMATAARRAFEVVYSKLSSKRRKYDGRLRYDPLTRLARLYDEDGALIDELQVAHAKIVDGGQLTLTMHTADLGTEVLETSSGGSSSADTAVVAPTSSKSRRFVAPTQNRPAAPPQLPPPHPQLPQPHLPSHLTPQLPQQLPHHRQPYREPLATLAHPELPAHEPRCDRATALPLTPAPPSAPCMDQRRAAVPQRTPAELLRMLTDGAGAAPDPTLPMPSVSLPSAPPPLPPTAPPTTLPDVPHLTDAAAPPPAPPPPAAATAPATAASRRGG